MATPKDAKETGGAATAEQEQPQAPPNPENAAAVDKAIQGTTLPATRPAGAAGVMKIGIAPSSIEEGWRMAQILAKSQLVPKNFQNKPEDVLVAIQMGIEIGFAPMQALQSIAVINGRPSVWGDGFLALLMASPLYADHDEYYEVGGARRDGLTPEDLKKDSTTAVCTFWRRGKTTPVTRRFTVGQARKADLLGKSGPWQTYPDRMLAMRARSWAGRDTFPDLLRGIRTAEEAMDTPDVEIEVQPVREVRRVSETVASEPSAPAPAESAAPPIQEVTIGPVGVKNVEQFLGGFTITLSDGQKIDTIEAAEALDCEKVKGTKHQLRFVCIKGDDGNLQLKSFGIAD